MSKNQLMTEAMKLAPEERGKFAEELLRSLTPEGDVLDAELLAEIERRDAAYRAGKMSAKPAEEVLQRLLNKSKS